MSAPITRPLNFDPYEVESNTSRSAGRDITDRNSGNYVRVVVDTGKSWLICGISVAINIVALIAIIMMISEARVSRNHWSNIEVDVEVLKREVNKHAE